MIIHLPKHLPETSRKRLHILALMGIWVVTLGLFAATCVMAYNQRKKPVATGKYVDVRATEGYKHGAGASELDATDYQFTAAFVTEPVVVDAQVPVAGSTSVLPGKTYLNTLQDDRSLYITAFKRTDIKPDVMAKQQKAVSESVLHSSADNLAKALGGQVQGKSAVTLNDKAAFMDARITHTRDGQPFMSAFRFILKKDLTQLQAQVASPAEKVDDALIAKFLDNIAY